MFVQSRSLALYALPTYPSSDAELPLPSDEELIQASHSDSPVQNAFIQNALRKGLSNAHFTNDLQEFKLSDLGIFILITVYGMIDAQELLSYLTKWPTSVSNKKLLQLQKAIEENCQISSPLATIHVLYLYSAALFNLRSLVAVCDPELQAVFLGKHTTFDVHRLIGVVIRSKHTQNLKTYCSYLVVIISLLLNKTVSEDELFNTMYSFKSLAFGKDSKMPQIEAKDYMFVLLSCLMGESVDYKKRPDIICQRINTIDQFLVSKAGRTFLTEACRQLVDQNKIRKSLLSSRTKRAIACMLEQIYAFCYFSSEKIIKGSPPLSFEYFLVQLKISSALCEKLCRQRELESVEANLSSSRSIIKLDEGGEEFCRQHWLETGEAIFGFTRHLGSTVTDSIVNGPMFAQVKELLDTLSSSGYASHQDLVKSMLLKLFKEKNVPKDRYSSILSVGWILYKIWWYLPCQNNPSSLADRVMDWCITKVLLDDKAYTLIPQQYLELLKTYFTKICPVLPFDMHRAMTQCQRVCAQKISNNFLQRLLNKKLISCTNLINNT